MAGALSVLLSASAQPTAARGYGGVLVVGLTKGDADTLDPTLSFTFSSVEIDRTMCERLYDFDARAHVVPQLASALPTVSKDKLTYTIPLRRGLLFNDGTPFDAQAVVVSLERVMTLPGSPLSSDLSAVDTVTASGRYTVVIHLRTPFTPLPATLATVDADMMSPAQLTKLGSNFGSDPVGVGPFMFDHRDTGQDVTVIKSPYYYDRNAVHLNKIVFVPEPDAAAAAAALEAGDVQMLDSVAPSQLPALQHSPSVHLIRQPSLGWTGIFINIGDKNGAGKPPYVNVGTPLAQSAMLRQAFEEAIDRNALVRVVYAGAAVPDCTPISPASPAYDASIRCPPFDPKAAKKLVGESGYPNPTVHLLTANTTLNTTLAEFVQAEEAAIGINVVIDAVDAQTSQDRAASGSFDTQLGGWTGSPATDRNVYPFVATTGHRNFSGYSNPRLDLILENSRKAITPKALRTLYHAAFQIILADRPIVFLDHAIAYAAVSSNVKGVEFLSDTQARVNFAQYR
jgi:peptide/nickel transport system substrate-binding protein